VGWALGIGRLGSIGGPLLIGVLLAYQLSAASLFYGRRPYAGGQHFGHAAGRQKQDAVSEQLRPCSFDAVSADLHQGAMGGIIPRNLRSASLICSWSAPRAAAQSAAIPGPIPDNARLASYLPFEWMLPKEVPPRATAAN
jgi:hypothetical protein